MSSPFFSKREPQVFNARTPNNPLPSAGSSIPSEDSKAALPIDKTPRTALSQPVASGESAGSKLTVGPNIKLKGVEITDCDTLVVEGTVEATMDSRVIHIAQQGAFHGAAEVDIAEIHGEFTGTLTVRDKLTIHSTGKVSGKLRYGKIVMEEGGQLSGEVVFGTAPWPALSHSQPTKAANIGSEAATV